MSLFAMVIGGLLSFFQRVVQGGAKKINVSMVTAILVSGMVFAYGSIWWIKASGGDGAEGSGIKDLVAFIVIFLLSMGLGRFIFFGGVLLAVRGEEDLKIGKINKFRKKHLFALLFISILLFSFLFFLVGTRITEPTERESSDYSTVHVKERMVFVAVDGLDDRLARQLMADGKMPNIKRLIENSASANLSAEGNFVPPVFWTTIATGMNPLKHGIGGISARRVSGVDTPLQTPFGESAFGFIFRALVPDSQLTRHVPVTANLRRSKTFWNIMNDNTYTVGIVNWWVSWPCEEVKGFMASERTLIKLQTDSGNEKDIEPVEFYEMVEEKYPSWRESFAHEFHSRFPAVSTRITKEDIETVMEAARIDWFYFKLFNFLSSERKVKFLALYLPGADIVKNRFFADIPADGLGRMKARLELLCDYYTYVDSLIGRTRGYRDNQNYFAILFTSGRATLLEGAESARTGGRFLIRGPGTKPGVKAIKIRDIDIAPTLLYLFGFPQSEDFEGEPVTGLFKLQLTARLTTEKIETFGDRKSEERKEVESRFSREVLEQLKNLGYIN
jgi:predicted AlkP superfamily phosphohydrolase/phosphomutase